MTSVWFRVEDGICYGWMLLLSLLLIRNLYLELRFIPPTESKPIVRLINRTAIVFLVSVIIVSPDYRTIYGIYSSLNLVLNLGYGVASTALYAAVSIYMYYTFEAASVATARDFHSNDLNWIVQALKTAFVFNIVLLLCITTILMTLTHIFDTALFIGVWQFYLSAVTFFLVAIFIHASRKLRKALTPFLNQQVFVSMDKRLRNVQFALVPVAIALFFGLIVIAFDNLRDERNIRDPDNYNFTYGIFMWFMLAVESIAQYSAWLPGKDKLIELYPKKDSPKSRSSQRGSKRFSFSRSSQKRLSAMYSRSPSGHSGDSRSSLIHSNRNSAKDTLPLSRSPSSGAFALTPQAILHIQPISPDSGIEISAMALPSMSRMASTDSAIVCVAEDTEQSVTHLSVTLPPNATDEARPEGRQEEGVSRVVVAI